MSPLFKKKPLVTQETLGEKLRKVRLGRNWTLEEASRETRIALRHLRALEESLYDEIPGEVYITNFIKIYSKALGLMPKQSLAQYQEEKHIIEKKKQHHVLKEIGKIPLIDRMLGPRTVRLTLICTIVLIVLSYIIFSVYQTIAPPILTIHTPKDNIETSEFIITIRGKTEPEAQLFVNNQEVIIDTDGSFQKQIHLREGLNLVTISAKTKHSRERKVVRHILVGNNPIPNE